MLHTLLLFVLSVFFVLFGLSIGASIILYRRGRLGKKDFLARIRNGSALFLMLGGAIISHSAHVHGWKIAGVICSICGTLLFYARYFREDSPQQPEMQPPNWSKLNKLA